MLQVNSPFVYPVAAACDDIWRSVICLLYLEVLMRHVYICLTSVLVRFHVCVLIVGSLDEVSPFVLHLSFSYLSCPSEMFGAVFS